jgi:hypothetical protein
MGLFKRVFGNRQKRLQYAPSLQTQIEKAVHALQLLTATHDSTWHIGTADWSVDQDKGSIVFTSPHGIRAVAPVQIVGTYNSQDGTWLWGWDHPSVVAPLAEHAKKVLAYGRNHGFDVLTTRKLECPEEQCWELTALACMLCDAQGAYRGPAGIARVFFTFGTVSLSKAS